MPSESLVDVINRLNEEGYTGQCRAERAGIRFLATDSTFRPQDLYVDRVVRIEGTSSPSEQVIVFALRSPDGLQRATYCVTHGPDIDPLDVDMLQQLDLRSSAGNPGHDAAAEVRI